jgi:hypothetical protein
MAQSEETAEPSFGEGLLHAVFEAFCPDNHSS